MRLLSVTIREQLIDKYTACELIEALGTDVGVIIDVFENEIEDMLNELLDASRGIGL